MIAEVAVSDSDVIAVINQKLGQVQDVLSAITVIILNNLVALVVNNILGSIDAVNQIGASKFDDRRR
jgi:ketopantoate reductase